MKKVTILLVFIATVLLGSSCSKDASKDAVVQITVVKDLEYVADYDILVVTPENLALAMAGEYFEAMETYQTNAAGIVNIVLRDEDFFAEEDHVSLGFLCKDSDNTWMDLPIDIEAGGVYSFYFTLQ